MIDRTKLIRWYDLQAPFYRLWRNRADSPLVPAVLERLGEGDGLRVLDAGCGTGLFALGIARARPTWHVEGIDASRGMLRVAQREARRLGLSNLALRRGDVSSLPYRAGQFDAVVAAGLIPLLDDPLRVMHEFARVLGPSGFLVSVEFDRAAMSRGTRWFFRVMIFGFRVVSTLAPRYRYARRWDIESSTIEPRLHEQQLARAGFRQRSLARVADHLVYLLQRDDEAGASQK